MASTAHPGSLPLRGAGVLITRPARQAGGFAAKVAAIGGAPIVFPAIVILPPADEAALQRAHASLATYDYAVFVSANAAEYGVPDPRAWPPRLAAFAPGQGTAETLHALGLHDVRTPQERQDSAGLLALPEFTDPAGKRVLIFRGDGGREELADTLRQRGAHVDYVACYRRARPDPSARGLDDAFAEGRIAAVTITSSEGLDNLFEVASAASRERWRALPTFVPHERIAARAGELGLRSVLTGPGDAGLLAGLLEWFSTRPA